MSGWKTWGFWGRKIGIGRHVAWLLAGFSLLGAPGAGAQILVGGDIPWESQFNALVTLAGQNPATFDVNTNSILDSWEYTLAERLLTDASAPAHRQAMLNAYNANYNAFVSEEPTLTAYAHYLTLVISRGELALVESQVGVTLTDALYTGIRELYDNGDPDGDAIQNLYETGTDAASYTASAITSSRSFQFGSEAETDLLDAAFYNGGQRGAFWGQLNNAGTTVAFHGVDFSQGFQTEIYLVELGDPSSWRQLTTGFNSIPQAGVSWSPDDSRLFIGGQRVEVATGTVSTPDYLGRGLADCVITGMPSDNYLLTLRNQEVTIATDIDFFRVFDAGLLGVDGLGGVVNYEWDNDGDTEGWTPIHHISSMPVSGGFLSPVSTGNDPYMHGPAVSFSAAANPYIAIRLRQDFDSATRIFWTTDIDPNWGEDKFVQVYVDEPGVFDTIVVDMSSHPDWTGTITGLRIDPHRGSESNIFAIPVHPNGNHDSGRDAVYVTDFKSKSLVDSLDWIAVAPDFSALAVVDYTQASTPGVPDRGQILVVRDLAAIVAAPTHPGSLVSTLAPTSPETGSAAPLTSGAKFVQAPLVLAGRIARDLRGRHEQCVPECRLLQRSGHL